VALEGLGNVSWLSACTVWRQVGKSFGWVDMFRLRFTSLTIRSPEIPLRLLSFLSPLVLTHLKPERKIPTSSDLRDIAEVTHFLRNVHCFPFHWEVLVYPVGENCIMKSFSTYILCQV
jgi:hypothetical protein